MIKNFWHNIEQILLAIDQLFNVVLCVFFNPLDKVYADESLSAHAFRASEDSTFWYIARKFIDVLFFWQDDHCENAYYSERDKKQLPPEYRN